MDHTLSAVGTYGGEMFERFFREFGFRLALEYRTGAIHDSVGDTSEVMRLADFCHNQVLC